MYIRVRGARIRNNVYLYPSQLMKFYKFPEIYFWIGYRRQLIRIHLFRTCLRLVEMRLTYRVTIAIVENSQSVSKGEKDEDLRKFVLYYRIHENVIPKCFFPL